MKRQPSEKAQIRKLKKEVAELEESVLSKTSSIQSLEAHLQEARRRTIPFLHGGGSLNFLPAFVSNVERRQDSRQWRGLDGSVGVAYGEVEVLIHAFGKVVEHKE